MNPVQLLPDHAQRLARARLALEGLSLGDAFGQCWFMPHDRALHFIALRADPAPPWRTTDDTEMAVEVFNTLSSHGTIDRDELATRFAQRYMADPMRGYGGTAHGILQAIASGVPWAFAAGRVFGGEGSMGNGAAMRVAPVGAYFADDLDAAITAAIASAEPTHAHPEGIAGAVAVAVASVYAWRAANVEGFAKAHPSLLAWTHARTPAGDTRRGLAKAMDIGPDATVALAASVLGTGEAVTSPDTVPFALWCADRCLDRFEDALWITAEGLGDRDTTCAIVGGIVALRVGDEGLPAAWRAAREPIAFLRMRDEDAVRFER